MKKICFLFLSFFMFFSFANAHIKDVQFVGGTGGSKILELNMSEDSLNTSGVIYDRNASLVYEITYTNDSDLDKKVTDVILPDTDILLSYDISDIDKDRIIKSGETVNFKYSIKALENVSDEQLESLNENARAKLVLSSVEVVNPETLDFVVLIVLFLIISFSLYKLAKDKKVFYGCLVIGFVSLLFSYSRKVVADDVEIVNLDTAVKYVFSNLAPSCANLDYEGDFCIDWKQYGNRDVVHYLVMEDYKVMKDSYAIGNVTFSLQNTYDVSEQQNGDVVLGVYKAQLEEESYLFLIGQNGGVIVPKDASYQFSSYDDVNNKSENDFKYVKYADFSKFFSNKTTNMEYMLTGVGTRVNMEKIDLSGFETSNVTNMKGMFTGIGEFTNDFKLDISHFDTSKVTDMSWMFWEAAYESDTVTLDLSTFDTSKVTNMENMFYNFAYNSSEVKLIIDNFDTSNVENMNFMFRGFATFADKLEFDIYDFDVSKVKTMAGMFYDFNIIGKAVDTIDYFKSWNTKSLVDINGMFSVNIFLIYGTEFEPKELTIDLTGLDTGSVTNMSSMFSWNRVLTKLIVPDDFDTSNVVNMRYMFCSNGITDYYFLSKFDVSSVEDFSFMFQSFNGTELDLTDWDVSNGKIFNGIFNNSSTLQKINISGWDLKSATSTSSMFSNQKVLESLDLGDLNFVNSNDYNYMFSTSIGSSLKEVDLSGSDWNEEADATDMFKGISGSTIYVKDEKAKAFIEKQAPDCTVLIKE